MAIYSTDNGGFAVKCDDIKLFTEDSTWNTKLSQIAKTTQPIYIMTHYLNDLGYGTNNYIDQILSKRPFNIKILVNSEVADKAKTIKLKYPKLEFRCVDNLNAKVVLIAPQTVMYSSADFASPYCKNRTTGYNEKLIDFGVGFHSEEIFELMLKKFNHYWEQAEII